MPSMMPRKLYVSLILCGSLLVASTAGAQQADKDKMTKDSAMAKDDKMMAKDAMIKEKMMAPHGAFAGAEGHKAAGAFEIVPSNGKQQLKLSDDFSVDKGPDVYVVLSPTPRVSDGSSVYLGKVKKFKGAQSFDIPAHTDLTAYRHVVLWCKKYSVSMGAADLAAGDAMPHDEMHKDEMKKDEMKKN